MPPSMPPLNHFDYFTDIEEAFVRCRGKHLWLSPADWSLMQEWKDRDVPLWIILRSIENVFDRNARTQRRSQINSLRYCREEVEAQYKEWLRSQVGGRPSSDKSASETNLRYNQALPFPREFILSHLTDCHAKLLAALHGEMGRAQDRLLTLLRSVADELDTIAQIFSDDAHTSFEEYENTLNRLDITIDLVVKEWFPPAQLSVKRAQVESQLYHYQSRMHRNDFEEAVDRMLLKCLRDELEIPRLSFFNL